MGSSPDRWGAGPGRRGEKSRAGDDARPGSVAAFDFDGTITNRDSTSAFCLATVPRRRLGAALVRRLVRPAALSRVRWHQSQGHRIVLVSASLELLVEPWARTVGIHDVLATRLEVRDGRLTGRLHGRNCFGEEKVERLRALLGDLAGVDLYAYGDGRGDRELLAAAQHPAYRMFHGRGGR